MKISTSHYILNYTHTQQSKHSLKTDKIHKSSNTGSGGHTHTRTLFHHTVDGMCNIPLASKKRERGGKINRGEKTVEWAALEGRWMDERLTALRLPFAPPRHSIFPLHTAQPRNFSALTVGHKKLFNQTNGYLNENNMSTGRVRICVGKNAFLVVD